MDLTVFTKGEWIFFIVTFTISSILIPIFWRAVKNFPERGWYPKSWVVGSLAEGINFLCFCGFISIDIVISLIVLGNIFGILPLK